jgi:hypothetical protein
MACGGKLGKKSPIDMVVISDDQVIWYEEPVKVSQQAAGKVPEPAIEVPGMGGNPQPTNSWFW